MNPDGRNQRMDELLDAALRSYGEVEPRHGLEQRVLAAMEAERSRAAVAAPWWRRGWVAAAAVAAMMLLAWGVLSQHPGSVPGQPEGQQANRNSVHPPTQPPESRSTCCLRPRETQPVARVRHRLAQPTAAQAVRQESFPSPQPLSEQEQLLVSYVSQFREEALVVAKLQAQQSEQAFQEMQQRAGTPLR